MLYKKYAIQVVCVICSLVLLLSACSFVPPERKLSEMSDEELIQYLIDSGVPSLELKHIEVADLIRKFVVELEEDPDSPPAVSWSVLADMYEGIREAVKEYYKEDAAG